MAHAAVFLSLLLACLVLPPLILAGPALGILWVGLHILASLLAGAMAMVLVVYLYLLTLRTVGTERFKAVVTWVQLAVIGGIYAAMYLVPPLLKEFAPEDLFDGRSPWLALWPPAWFAGLVEAGLSGASESGAGTSELSPVVLGLAALAVICPLLLLFQVLRLARSGFLAALAAGAQDHPRPRKRDLGMFESLAQRFGLRGAERAGYQLFLALAGRDSQFRLRIWPVLVMTGAMCIGWAVRDGVHDPMLWSFAVYALIPVVPMVVEQSAYGESLEAGWIVESAPLQSLTELLRGARKGLVTGFTLLPGAVILALLTIVLGWRGLVHGALALELVLIATLLFLASLPMELPFSKKFRPRLGGEMMGIMLLSMVCVGILVGIHSVLAIFWPPLLFIGLLLLPAPIVVVWKRL
jgi:hypothetical protein